MASQLHESRPIQILVATITPMDLSVSASIIAGAVDVRSLLVALQAFEHVSMPSQPVRLHDAVPHHLPLNTG